MGRPAGNGVVELLGLLEDFVAIGRVICPISADTVAEVFKQADGNTLRVSAQLIDDLSKGVAILESDERIRLEILHFIREKVGGTDRVYRLDDLVWTKIAYVLGFATPSFDAHPPDLNLAMQKVVLDDMWTITLQEVLDQLGPEVELWRQSRPDSAPMLNDGKFAHIDDHSSFKELFLAELAGILDVFEPVLDDLMGYLYEYDVGRPFTEDELSAHKPGHLLGNLVYHAFRLNKMTCELPSFRVGAGLHAAVRWDKKRKYKANDLHDFRHAVAAVPYCDYFLTEKSLRTLVGNKNLQLKRLFDCQTLSDARGAVEALAKLGR